MKPQIALFLKFPEPGRVKTRLAKELGGEAAAEFFRLSVANLLTNLAEYRSQFVVFYEASHSKQQYQDWLGADLRYLAQVEGGLGQRLKAAVELLWPTPKRPVVLLGGDAPNLGTGHIEQCLEDLAQPGHLVLGPSLDGGYYLLGLNGPNTELFEDVPWSTSEVAQATRERGERLGLTISELASEVDVDVAADLQFLERSSLNPDLAGFLEDLGGIKKVQE